MAAASAKLMDTDLLSNLHDDPGRGSPCKRRGVGQEDGVSMTLLREILADQTKTLLQHQTKSQSDLEKEMTTNLREDIRSDIRREMSQNQKVLKQEIQADLNKEIQALGRSCPAAGPGTA